VAVVDAVPAQEALPILELQVGLDEKARPAQGQRAGRRAFDDIERGRFR
jgi:hypothetical protein